MKREPATVPNVSQRIPRWVLAWPARVIFTGALLAILALQINWGEIGNELRGGDWRWFVAAVLVLGLALVVGAIRWHYFVRAAGLPASAGASIRAYFVGALYNNLLPTAFGGDVARVMMIGGRGAAVPAATSVTVDRLTSIACLILLAASAAVVDPAGAPGELRLLAVGAALTLVLVSLLLVAAVRAEPIRRRVPPRIRPSAMLVVATVRMYATSRRLVGMGLALGFLYQALVVLETVLLGRAIGLHLGMTLTAIVLPLVLIVTLIPISVAGFGLREGGFVALLGTAGVGSGPAAVLSLLSVAAMALASTPGAVGLLVDRGRLRSPERS